MSTNNEKRISNYTEALALLNESEKASFETAVETATKHTGLTPSDNQKIAAILLYKDNCIEMATGEGKTLAGLLCILTRLLQKRKITCVSANPYLSKRDYEFSKSSIMALGGKCAYYDGTNKQIRLEEMDVIYSDADVLIETYLNAIIDDKRQKLPYLTEGVIIDEFDYVTIDMSQKNHQLSKKISTNKKLIKDTFNKVNAYFTECEKIKEKPKMIDYLYREQIDHKDWSNNKNDIRKIICACFSALKDYKKDTDYIIENNKIVLIDTSTGRAIKNKVLLDYVHQALEAKEGVPISDCTMITIGISAEMYFSQYENLCGMSGTLSEEKTYIKEHYHKDLYMIDLDRPTQRVLLDDAYCLDEEQMIDTVIQKVEECQKVCRPIMVVCKDIEESKLVSLSLKEKGYPNQLLNATNAAEEAKIIAKAGRSNAITITTSMAGRGTDIVPDEKALENGGLFILSTSHMASARHDRQLIGRTGRRGDKGEFMFIERLDANKQDEKGISTLLSLNYLDKDRMAKMASDMTKIKQKQNDDTARKVRDAKARFDNTSFDVIKHLEEYKCQLINDKKLLKTKIAKANGIIMECYRELKDIIEEESLFNVDNEDVNEYFSKRAKQLEKEKEKAISLISGVNC